MRARERDVVDVVPRRVGHRARLAPARHPAVDEPRVAGQARVRADAEPLGDAGPEPLEERVGRLDKAEQRLDALRALQVDADRAPVPVQDRHSARVKAVLNRLDPVDAQNVGAQVGEHHRRERAGPDPDELHHLQRGQRPSHDAPP